MAVSRYDWAKLLSCLVLVLVLVVILISRARKEKPEEQTAEIPELGPPRQVIAEDVLPLAAEAADGDEKGEGSASEDGPARSEEGNGTVKPDVDEGGASTGGEPVESQAGPVEHSFPYGPEVMDSIQDRTRSLEEGAYYYLVRQVSKRSHDQLRTECTPATWREVFVSPTDHRGKVVQVTGNLLSLKVMPLSADRNENPTGIHEVYFGQIVDKEFKFWTFILTEKPEETILIKDLVRVYGLFFKVWEYETNIPNAFKLTPVVVARDFVQVQFQENHLVKWCIVALVVVTGLVLFVAVRWERRSDSKVSLKRQEKVKERRPKGINELGKILAGQAAEERSSLFRRENDVAKDHSPGGKADGTALLPPSDPGSSGSAGPAPGGKD
ncbi:MAG: hypothetical protein HYU36_20220 [Planctomycetes bacterium]|nr:hypothetical protein [Planctomycetota bacterium]